MARLERSRITLLAVLALLASAVGAPTAGAAPPFAADSFWNTPIPSSAPLNANSDAYVADLQRQLTQWAPYINTTKSSTPVYTVPADQPTVRVVLGSTSAAPDLRAAWEQVPIPADAVPAVGTDAHMVIHQPSTDTMWEFWRAAKLSDGWHAAWGGRMTNVSTNPGFFTNPTNWGATATSLPLLGGLIRLDELEAGHIDHALALVIPEPRRTTFAWPAQRTDGTSDRSASIPEGTRLRLDPKLDLDKLELAPVVRMVAEAAQRYGVVVRDKGGAIAFEAEDPTPTGTNPFAGPTGWFEGRGAAALMREFPWSRLQALPTRLRTQPPGSAYVANGVLTVVSARNLLSNLRVEQSGTTTVTISDTGALDAVGSKCTQLDPSRVSCVGATSADLSGSYKADTIRMLAPIPAMLSGNTSADRLYGGSRGDTLNGDDGDDVLVPGGGVDRINGGVGSDYADYGARTTALTLSLDGLANDGQAGEGDNIAADVESLVGGSANDILIGSAAANALWGQAGNDTVQGDSGVDWLNGGNGNDTIDGGTGIDAIRGDAGTDTIRSRDSLADDVGCGAGTDQVIGDLIDKILRAECEGLSLF